MTAATGISRPRARRRITLGLLAVLLVTGATVAVTACSGNDTGTVEAVFADASGVTLGYQVRANGLQVGTVSAVRVDGGRARLSLTVDDAVLPLRTDARATVRSANLLGESYVELDPGRPTAPLLDQPMIEESHTSSAVTLQQVLDTFDDPTATALATTVTGLGEGVGGAGPAAADALAALRPAMARTGELSSVLAGQNAVLNQLVERTQPIADAVAGDDGRRLEDLLEATRDGLGTVAADRAALDATLAELPSTIASARRTLGQLAGTADAATPTLASIRPVTRDLDTISRELGALADSADPALGALQPVLEEARGLLDEARPVVDGARAAGPDLRRTAAGLRPVGAELLDPDRHLVDLMEFVRKWSLSTNGSDGISHYFRGLVHASPSAMQQLVAGSPLGGAVEKLAPQATAPFPTLPGTGRAPAAPSGPVATTPGNVTGLDPEQERSMVGQLLGGR